MSKLLPECLIESVWYVPLFGVLKSCHKDRSCDSVLSLSGEIMEENIAFVKVKKEHITIVTIISTCDLIPYLL